MKPFFFVLFFNKYYLFIFLKKKRKRESQPLNITVTGAKADCIKNYKWERTDSYELATNFSKHKIG